MESGASVPSSGVVADAYVRDLLSVAHSEPSIVRSAKSRRSASRRSTATMSATKRAMDIVFATLLLIFFLPVTILICIGLVLQDGFPLIYRHERIGMGGRTFQCFKFRSMARDADERLRELLTLSPQARREWEEGQKLRSDPRIHPLGLFLRVFSLDEIPQLFNVLKGDMSLVGPRPIVQSEVVRYGRRFSHYKLVRPGLTGLWQVSGRNNTSYRKRVALDLHYIRNRSIVFDFKIMIKTAYIVFGRRGAY